MQSDEAAKILHVLEVFDGLSMGGWELLHGPHTEMKDGTEKRPKRVILELTKRLVARLECRLLLQLLRRTKRLLGSMKVEQLFLKERAILDFSLSPSGLMELKASVKRALSTYFEVHDNNSALRISSAYSAKTWPKKTLRSSDR